MAKKVSGITVEIGGDTTKLGKALADVDSQSRSLQNELKGVESLLKFDPSNVELLRQKQEILNDSIDNTRQKLKILKDTQEQVQAQFDRGDITAQQYRDFQREIVVTDQKLQGLEGQLKDMGEAGKDSLDGTSEALDGVDDSAGKAKGGLEKLTDVVSSGVLMEVADNFSQIGQKIVDIGELALDAFGKVDEGLDTIITKTGATGETMAGLEDVYQAIASTMPVDLAKVGEAVGEVNTQFGLTGDGLQKASEQVLAFSEITGNDVTSSTMAAKQAMSAYNLEAGDLEYILDSVTSASQNSGVAASDLFSKVVDGAPQIKALGLEFNEGVELMGKFEKAGVDSSATLASLSKASVVYAKDGKTLSEGLQGTVEAIMNATSETEALTIASEVFGTKGAGRMVDAIQRGAISFEDLGTNIEGIAGITESTFAATLDPIDEMTVAQNNLTLGLAELGGAIAETLAPVLQKLSEIIQSVTAWFANLSPGMKDFIVIIGLVTAAITLLLPVVATIAAAFAIFGTATLPLVGAIAGIIAAVTAGIMIFKNWGAITDWLSEKWDQFVAWIGPIIQTMLDGISAAFEASVEWIKGVWAAIPEFFAGLWAGIQEGAANIWASVTEAWNIAVEYVKSIWTGITTFFSELWLSITEATAAAWQAIIDSIMVVVSPFIETYKLIWSSVSDHLGTLWTSIQTIATSAWEIIKNVILAPVLMLVDLVTGDFDSMGSHLSQIWTNIQTAASNIWTAIKDGVAAIIGVFVGIMSVLWDNLKNNTIMVWELIKSTAINIWNSLKDAVINGANALKDGAINAWNNVKTGVINAANGLKDGAVNAWNSLKSSVINAATSLASSAVSTWNNLKSSVANLANSAKDGAVNAWNSLKSMTSSIFNGVVSSIKSILNINLFSIGRNIIDGLVNGIKNGVGAVGAAISEVAGNIKSKIKGALGINSPSRWMRDVVGKMIPQGIAVGVKADTSKAIDAMDDLTAGVMDAGSPDMMKMMNGNSIVSQSAQMDALKSSLGASGTLAAKVDAMIGLLSTYLPNLNAEPYIVMDTGALVGEIKNEMNQALGNEADLERRGR